jgi:hypothetical protein
MPPIANDPGRHAPFSRQRRQQEHINVGNARMNIKFSLN